MAQAVAQTGRRFSLALYIGIVFSLTWPFQFAIYFWAHSMAQAIGLSAVSMWMVGLATFLADRVVFHQGFSSAGWTWGKAWHYVLVVCLAVLLWPVPAAVEYYWGVTLLPKGLTVAGCALVFGVLILVLLGAAFAEELGWRGYLLPRLAARTTPRRAVLIHGLLWFCWHLPLVGTGILAGGMEITAVTGLPRALTIPAVTIVAAFAGTMHAAVLAFIWTRSGSLAVVTVYHALHDSLRDTVTVTVGLASLSAWWAVGVISALGAVLLLRGDWKELGKLAETQVEPAPQTTEHQDPEAGLEC